MLKMDLSELTRRMFLDECKLKSDLTNNLRHLAAAGDVKSLITLLMCHRASGGDLLDVNSAEEGTGRTALMFASEFGHADICRLLLQNGAEVNAVDNVVGSSALILAADNGHLRVCQILVQNDAKVNALDDNDRSALMLAVIKGHVKICKLLLKRYV